MCCSFRCFPCGCGWNRGPASIEGPGGGALLARRERLDLRDDDGGWRPLPDPRRNSLLDRAVRTLPGLQGVEARLLRLIERKLERREPIEPVQRKPRARAPIAVDAAKIAAEIRKLDQHVLRNLLARGVLGQRSLRGLGSFSRRLLGASAFSGGDFGAIFGTCCVRRW